MSLQAAADEALERARRAAPGLEVEVYLYRGEERGVELREGRPDGGQQSSETGIGLRVIQGGRTGFAYAGGRLQDAAEELAARARGQLARMEPDRHRRLPEPSPCPAEEGFQRSLSDPTLFTTPLKGWEDRLLELSAGALSRDRRVRKVLSASYGEGRAEVAIANTLGVRALEAGTSASVGLAVAAESGAEVQVGSASQSSRRSSELDWRRLAEDAVFRAASLLDSRKLPTKRRAVVFDPWLSGEFLELFVSALSAEAVQRGRSLLKGRLGKEVASPLVTFVDDPRRPGGAASALFDDEGVPTRRKTMVGKGVLKDYFHDTYTAAKEGAVSNGCAGRAGFKSLPGPTSSNFYLEPGTLTREALIADTRDGILALELMGMHTADPISGEFSVGVSGIAIEGGKLTRGIRGAMVSGNVLDVLSRVDAVASDLTFYGSWATPTFRVGDLTVA